MNRYTFVVHVYPGGASMVENLSTHERARVPDLGAVGQQLEWWLAALARSPEPVAAPTDPRAPPAPAA